jgi:alpha-tubulin suppressor-like RCC1 family protein
MQVAAPIYSPLPNTFDAPQNITMTSTTPNVQIYYTTNGTDPTTSSTPYTAPFKLSINCSLKAKAYRNGWSSSNVSQGSYNFSVAAPVLNPPAGTYSQVQTVTMTTATTGAEIHYTTNNTEPSLASTLYTTPIEVATSTLIKAKAFKTSMIASTTTTALYNLVSIVATPTFDPPGGVYTQPIDVAILCATPNADIRYTLDGTEPNPSSSLFTTPLPVSANVQIKAKAYKNGWTTSPTAQAVYQLDTFEQIVAWGSNTYNQCNAPLGYDFLQIESGMYHTVGLRTDGSLVAWGRNNSGQCNYPMGNDYIAVSAGSNHSLALKTDGSIVAWGANTDGQCDVPDSLGYQYVAIAAGSAHSLALTDGGVLVAWGSNSDNQCTVPEGNTFTKIAAGAGHNLALRANGTLIAWGNNDNGQTNAPTGNNYVDIAAGDQHCIAKRTSGNVVGWGSNSDGQANSPTGTDFVKISAGYRHNLALRSNGSIVSWGYSGSGLAEIPMLGTYVDVSAGRDFSTALKASTTNKGKIRLYKPGVKIRKK